MCPDLKTFEVKQRNFINIGEYNITGERLKFRQLEKFTFDCIESWQQWHNLRTIFKDTNTKLIAHTKILMGPRTKN